MSTSQASLRAGWNKVRTLGDYERAEFMANLLKKAKTLKVFRRWVRYGLQLSDVEQYEEMAAAFSSTIKEDWTALGWAAIRATHRHKPEERAKIRESWRVVVKKGRPFPDDEVARVYGVFHKPKPKRPVYKVTVDLDLILNGFTILSQALRDRGVNPDRLLNKDIKDAVARRMKRRERRSVAA